MSSFVRLRSSLRCANAWSPRAELLRPTSSSQRMSERAVPARFSRRHCVPIVLHPASERDRAVWLSLLEFAERASGWTLIGARMVELHAAERGRVLSRISIDGDALADARDRDGTRRISRALIDAGFELTEPSVMGLGHVFVRAGAQIDVL